MNKVVTLTSPLGMSGSSRSKAAMDSIQPALDGTVPEPTPRVDDFETWVDQVRPVFEKVAATGQPFTSWQVANEHHLPEPPNSQSHWGSLISRLRDDGLIAQYGWANSTRPGDNGSGVKVWRGTRSARIRRGQAA